MNNFVGDGNGYVGNLALAPERAVTASVTFDLHAADRRWELQATPYAACAPRTVVLATSAC